MKKMLGLIHHPGLSFAQNVPLYGVARSSYKSFKKRGNRQMREIKFRVWNTNEFPEGKMYYSDKPIKLKNNFIVSLSDFFKTYCENEFNMSPGKIEYELNKNIMQYTGLKDKNSKEIYEGDIVYGLIDCGNHWGYGIVKFGDLDTRHGYISGFYIELTHEECSDAEYNVVDQCFEVMGNIHEATPEQLKEWGIKC